MKTFIQLKDGIGWAFVDTIEPIEGAIEVEFGTGSSYIKKKYEDGVWTDADLIKFAEVNDEGIIVEVKRTYFLSEVDGPIMNPDTKMTAKWVNNNWVTE